MPHRLRVLVVAAGLFVGLAACGGGATERLGIPAVYDRIDSLTDCAELQAEFNTAMDNVERRPPGDDRRAISLTYAKYADERMREIGCYG